MASQSPADISGFLPELAAALEREAEPRVLRRSAALWRTVLGVVLALVLFELLLRPFPGQVLRFDTRPVHEDRLDAPVLTVPYHLEGFSTAHFTPSRARLTGNAVVPGAPFVVLVGDSYVEALQVQDEQTMGSVLERTSRSRQRPVNVRQYGFSGDSPAHYALMADEILETWKPQMVCVVVNADDFTQDALTNHWAEMKLHGNQPPTISVADEGWSREMRVRITAKLQHSGLLYALAQRTVLDILPTFNRNPPPDAKAASVEEAVDPAVIKATVQALKDAYGSHLMVLLIQNPGISGGTTPTRLETILSTSCAEQGVDCVMTREAFANLRDHRQELGFGFSNTLPGAGHINVVGHQLVGELIWAEYQKRIDGTR